jgi:hypothetical protein
MLDATAVLFATPLPDSSYPSQQDIEFDFAFCSQLISILLAEVPGRRLEQGAYGALQAHCDVRHPRVILLLVQRL